MHTSYTCDDMCFCVCREQWKAESSKPLLSSDICGVGEGYPFHCMCKIPGQMPCPSRRPLPEKFKGKWHLKPEERDLMDQKIYKFDQYLTNNPSS